MMGKQLRYVEICVKTRAVKVLEDFEAGCLENDLGKIDKFNFCFFQPPSHLKSSNPNFLMAKQCSFFSEASSAPSIGKRIDSKALYKNSELEAIGQSGGQVPSVREISRFVGWRGVSLFPAKAQCFFFGKIFLNVC